jgi:hypothetical protein
MGICEGFGGFAGSKYTLMLFYFGALPFQDSHEGTDVDFTFWHFCCTEKNMPAKATCPFDLNRVLATTGGSAVESNLSALVTIRRVDRPCGRVQSLFKVVRDLADGEGKEGKSEKDGVE